MCEKEKLGLDAEDEGEIGVIINTSMSPWLRAQKTFKRIGFIIRNELYNAYGAVRFSLQVIIKRFLIRFMMSLNTLDWYPLVLSLTRIGMETFLLSLR